jgi:hypothetical protein
VKYLCFGYIEPGKFEGMTENEQRAVLDECFEHNDHLRANGQPRFAPESLEESFDIERRIMNYGEAIAATFVWRSIAWRFASYASTSVASTSNSAPSGVPGRALISSAMRSNRKFMVTFSPDGTSLHICSCHIGELFYGFRNVC